jgi:hypothetical protein
MSFFIFVFFIKSPELADEIIKKHAENKDTRQKKEGQLSLQKDRDALTVVLRSGCQRCEFEPRGTLICGFEIHGE